MRSAAIWILAALTMGADPTAAQPAAQQNICFPFNQMEGWKAPDNKTIFIRVNLNRYYRLDLAGSCPALTMPNSHLVTKITGTDLICSAIDWQLSVAQSPPESIPEPCIVKKMTLLTPQEAAAIPPKYKP
ncbi:MAG TPA: DUF6491 family protein [Rhizomicrobium sp.]|nr:DUF6491 family protein [Rhizomicrobium sp.]